MFVDAHLKRLMQEPGIKRPLLAGNFSGRTKERIAVKVDETIEINEWFYYRGWTDGLPIVPPTEKRVREILKGSDLSSDHVVAILEPMGGQATVAKIAVNAVMAGCRPEYMPVLMAAVELVAGSEFDLKGVSTKWVFKVKDPASLVPSPFIDHFLILVSGGTGEKSVLIPVWSASAPVSKEIRLPSYWPELLEQN